MVFLDESGFSLIPCSPKTWAPKGCTPVLKHRISWPKLSTIAAVAPNPHVWLHQVRGTVKSADVVRFLRYLLGTTSRPIMRFWEGLGGSPLRPDAACPAGLAQSREHSSAPSLCPGTQSR